MGKYLKKFTTKDEHDSFLTTERNMAKPNISLIQNEKMIKYNSIFPLYITTWKDNKQDVHGETTKVNKKLYEYYMENCIADPQGVNGETILHLSNDQVLYIDGIKVTHLYQDSSTVLQKTIQWYPNNVWDANSWYYGGGIHADGSIYVVYDD